MEGEQWRPVEGYEGRYEVSNTGKVRSVARCNETLKHICWPEREMKLGIHNNGYQVVWLRKPGTKQKFFVHRIVAFAFLEVVEEKEYVNHKDKDRLNNHIDNLEFMTHQENCNHRDGKVCNDEPF